MTTLKKNTIARSEQQHATSCFLCRGAGRHHPAAAAGTATAAAPPCNKCRTCGRQFATFQALGGHRTSHFRRSATKKLRPEAVAIHHACATCGMGFSTGQALGGHMRRHRGPTTATEDSGYVGLAQIIAHERPSSAPLQLLNLFV